MYEFIIRLFGEGKELNALQVGTRSLLMFIVALLLLRVGGIRIFGKKSAFDDIVAVMLGAILSRGVMGASPFGVTIAAGGVLVIIHRLVSWACIKSRWANRIIKGEKVLLYKDGVLLHKNLERCSLSKEDLLESLRLHTNRPTLEDIDSAFMETSGRISFIMKQKNKPIPSQKIPTT